jgi:protein O-GlcNAc transferase
MMSSTESAVAQARACLARGDLDQAATLLERVLQIDSRHAAALHFMALIAYQAGQTDKALALLQASVAIDPLDGDAQSNLGTVALAAGQFALAEQALRTAVARHPNHAVIQFNFGNALATTGKHAEAAKALERAVALQPTHAEAHNNLGIVYRDLENLPGATASFKSALQLKPDYAEAAYNLANAYRDACRLTKAEATVRQALALNPDYAKAYNSLGNILSESGRSDEALAAFSRASALEPTSPVLASNVLCCMQYIPGVTPGSLLQAHQSWAAKFTTRIAARHHTASAKTSRPLKVGFVSPDFGNHPCGFLSVRMFENLDRARIEPIVFSTRRTVREDAISQRIAVATKWRRVADLPDDALCDEIARCGIDILIDMSGHTSGNRLGVFARKPAALQMSWLGYVGTTGLDAMDYIIADRWHAPTNHEFAGPEQYLRLSDGYACFDPPADVGDVAPLPVISRQFVTFGNLNNATKLNSAMIESYARILVQVPRSRLLLRFRGLDDAGVADSIRSTFARCGISADRLDILGYAKRVPFLRSYNDVDIALDSFPYSGGLTTCEALWMGVPVVTFPGATFAGRHATSYMGNAGLADFVGLDQADFERIAVAKAQAISALAQLRQTLRERLLASPLCDGARFATAFANGLETAWQHHAARLS